VIGNVSNAVILSHWESPKEASGKGQVASGE
jgi:hypothetical protein